MIRLLRYLAVGVLMLPTLCWAQPDISLGLRPSRWKPVLDRPYFRSWRLQHDFLLLGIEHATRFHIEWFR